MAQITPSVGRKVWYYENAEQTEPWDATVIKVCDEPWNANPHSQVNLLVVDPDSGQQYFVPEVSHSPVPRATKRYAWMPYQEQQAARQMMNQNTLGCAAGQNLQAGDFVRKA